MRTTLVLPAALLVVARLAPVAVAAPASQVVAGANQVGVTLSNFGFLGNNFVNRTASLEYPLGTGYEHLPDGGLWIGAQAIDGNGPFHGVATACVDFQQGTPAAGRSEFTPESNGILRRSRNVGSPYYDPAARSHLDHVSEYSDLVARNSPSGPHSPLHVRVRQENYSWTTPGYENVVFSRYIVRNVGDPLADVWVGLYLQLASGSKNAYSSWPPSSAGGPGGWYGKKWLRWDPDARALSEHYCAGQPVPEGCNPGAVPPWIGVALLTPPAVGQSVTFAAWPWAPGDPARDDDAERYALMSSGTIADLSQPDLQPGTGDPVSLLALGPFPAIASGDSIDVTFAIVGGEDSTALGVHVAAARHAYDANYADDPVPVLPALESIGIVDESGAVRIVWGAVSGTTHATVERSAKAGEWNAVGRAGAGTDGRFEYVDSDPPAAGRVGYRLVCDGMGGAPATGEAWIDLPARAGFELRGLRRDGIATAGSLVVEFSLADDGETRVDLLDVGGRRLRSASERLTRGRHMLALGSAASIPAGVYFVRLSQGLRSAVRREIVAH